MSNNSFKSRNYIEAKSPRRLRYLMFKKQTELGMAALEFDIVAHNGKLQAWFYEIVKDKTLTEIVDGNTKDNRG